MHQSALTPSRRVVISLLTATLTLTLVWLLLCIDKIATPRLDEVQEVDAVYVIGPVETRLDEVLATMDSGVAPVLLATTSINQSTGEPYATDHCGEKGNGYDVECVLPDPYTTRGEARLLGEKIKENGWEQVAVMTSTPHAARTRLLMERCTDAEVLVWAVNKGETSALGWLSASIYQSGAWVKTQVVRGC